MDSVAVRLLLVLCHCVALLRAVDFSVEFRIGSCELSTVAVDQLAYEILKEEGADCLLSEVTWEYV